MLILLSNGLQDTIFIIYLNKLSRMDVQVISTKLNVWGSKRDMVRVK